jgi:hypothetical protein
MSFNIYNASGIVYINQDPTLQRQYFRCGGTAKGIGNDDVQIIIGKDTYTTQWANMYIDGHTPESQYAALYMLAQVFAGVPVNPPTPPPTTLKINPPSSTTFDIPEYIAYPDSDFTIEWLQYMHTNDAFQRIYSIGQYPAQNAVSIEGGVLYLWLNGSIVGSYDLSTLTNGYLNQWLHIVVTRYKGQLYVWAGYSNDNYTQLIYVAGYSDAIPTLGNDFYIGSENAPSTYYNGLISNFRWSAQSPVYGQISPTYPTIPLSNDSSTILLIGQGNDIGEQTTDNTGINIITNTNCIFNTDSGISGNSDGSIQFGTI